ncbi:NADH dehydrogenase [ubiquinone] 1 alpha subcomplex subunit 4-like 2 [Mobula hypostoma]|uniref:NADH dehydrogenase [ubiquinone] 1 alpha subcomplex subunit 4-like 2 n=1 Tax=Hypanus sabinus TaxID=79690 RepID=UPI0028C44187|nr:NADH dehydrogenase [ubiquinone] 1 alpha subcomplex subunit 4-like 2 [Hypanus sabinus]
MFRLLVKQARRHRGLIPLFFFIGLGMGSASLYLLRLAVRNPEVIWDRKNNPEPWNNLSPTHQYKFMAVETDYSKLKKERPDF